MVVLAIGTDAVQDVRAGGFAVLERPFGVERIARDGRQVLRRQLREARGIRAVVQAVGAKRERQCEQPILRGIVRSIGIAPCR